jgi:hypothetical protein
MKSHPSPLDTASLSLSALDKNELVNLFVLKGELVDFG